MVAASDKKAGENSRRQKRKEARLAQKQHKHQSWVEHQKHRKNKRDQHKPGNRYLNSDRSKELEISLRESDSERDDNTAEETVNRGPKLNSKLETKIEASHGMNEKINTKKKKIQTCQKLDAKRKRSKSMLEEYIEMEDRSALEDLEMERRLAKKLGIKRGKLKGADDGLGLLITGIPSVLDNPDEEHEQHHSGEVEVDGVGDDIKDSKRADAKKYKNKKKNKTVEKKTKGSDNAPYDKEREDDESPESREEGEKIAKLNNGRGKVHEVTTNVKYVAPHLRSQSSDGLEEYIHLRRRLRGLLNRLSESNVESITGEVSTFFQSVSRKVATEIISEEVLAACSEGPRATEQYASVFAAFVAGLACMVGIDFGAHLVASLARSFEDEYLKEDGLSLRNLTLLLSCLFIYGVCSSDLLYDFLSKLSVGLTEVDVSIILTVLQYCGMKLRVDDPDAMKKLVLSVQTRANELRVSATEGEGNTNLKRIEYLLDTICDIKNNKKRAKEDLPPQTRIKKWLQKHGVDNVEIRGIKWDKLLDPQKKGQWWLSGDLVAPSDNVEEVTSRIDREVTEAQKMLQLAAAQRMNTDTRRSIFCVIMSGEDYVDAFEKLLSLDLQGKQDREIMRVLLECCLQEKVFNKYYTALASKLCSHDKNHKFTLQYCLWDKFKELESMELLRSMNLAKFVAELLASFHISLAVLKVVDLADIVQLTPKRILHFRMLFETLFELPDSLVWNIFSRVAVIPELEDNGLELFIRENVVKNNKNAGKKLKVVQKALNNAAGVLM